MMCHDKTVSGGTRAALYIYNIYIKSYYILRMITYDCGALTLHTTTTTLTLALTFHLTPRGSACGPHNVSVCAGFVPHNVA